MYTFIVNPHARSGLGQTVWNELELILKSKHIEYEVFFTKYQKHATNITAQLTSDEQKHTIIALGGDGTVNEVVNGIQDYEKTIFGYIPIGSSNDFARGLELPKDPVEALNVILECAHLHSMNIGELRYQNKARRFATSAGMGFDATICHEAVVSRLKYVLNKLKLGKLTYAGIALHRLFLTSPQKVTVTIDDTTITFPSTYFVAILNNKYEGGGLKFCPDAKNNDDMLDIMVVDKVSKLKILMVLPTAFSGNHTHFKGVHIFTCKHVTVESTKPMALHTDGEPIFLQSKISASCLPQKLRVITRKEIS